MKKEKQGFTLLEMLVVVLIIGILAGIALPQYQNAVEKSKASEAILIMRNLMNQQALCILEHEDGRDADECTSGTEDNNLFTYSNIISGDPADDCEDPRCGPATKDFSYALEGDSIYANRLPSETKYFLSNGGEQGRIHCSNQDDNKNWCKIIGFTKYDSNRDWWFQP